MVGQQTKYWSIHKTEYWLLQCLAVSPPIERISKIAPLPIDEVYAVDPRKLRGNCTESHQIYSRCSELIATELSEIGIVTFQSFSECESDEWRWIGWFCQWTRPLCVLLSVQWPLQASLITQPPARYIHNAQMDTRRRYATIALCDKNTPSTNLADLHSKKIRTSYHPSATKVN